LDKDKEKLDGVPREAAVKKYKIDSKLREEIDSRTDIVLFSECITFLGAEALGILTMKALNMLVRSNE
jgi:hypothetical protein